MSVTTPSVRLE